MRLRGPVFLLCLSLLAACAVYHPPSLPPEQRALLVPPAKKWGDMLFIDKIDGASPSFAAAAGLKHSANPVVLAPGKHTIRVRVRIGLSEGLADLWLVAEAGKRYRVEKASSGYGFRAWFVDDETGELVGGSVGSDDEPH